MKLDRKKMRLKVRRKKKVVYLEKRFVGKKFRAKIMTQGERSGV